MIPTGIIRTLPITPYGDASEAAERCFRSIALLEQGRMSELYVALNTRPRHEVLHLYLLIAGEIIARFNIAGYESGESLKCWDGVERTPKFWAICTAPVSKPPVPIQRRGFQGFRYTEDLW